MNLKRISLALLLMVMCMAGFHVQTKAQPFQGVSWTYGIEGIHEAYVQRILKDPQGNFVLAGNFVDSADFDLGPGTFKLYSGTYQDVFVAKYNPGGALLWAKSFSGDGLQDQVMSFQMDASGNVFLSGKTSTNFDADPGPGTNLFSATNIIYYLSLDPLGNVRWADFWGTSADIDFALKPNGNTLVVASNYQNVDADPGPGVFQTNYIPGQRNFFMELDANGAFVSLQYLDAPLSNNVIALQKIVVDQRGRYTILGRYWGSPDLDFDTSTYVLPVLVPAMFVAQYDSGFRKVFLGTMGHEAAPASGFLRTDNQNHTYVVFTVRDTCDIDPGPNTLTHIPSVIGTEDPVCVKIDSGGYVVFSRAILGNNQRSISDLSVHESTGDIYFTGSFMGTMDLDWGAGIESLTSQGFRDGYVAKVDAIGGFYGGFGIGSTGMDGSYTVLADTGGAFYLGGFFTGTVDFDGGAAVITNTSTGQSDAFWAKYLEGPCANLSLQVTLLQHITCTNPTGMVVVEPNGGTPPYNMVWSSPGNPTGPVINPTLGGNYTVTMTDNGGCTLTRGTLVAAPPVPNIADLVVVMNSTNHRAGMPTNVYAYVYNRGCVPAPVNLKLALDSVLIGPFASPLPDSVVGNFIHWSNPPITFDDGIRAFAVNATVGVFAPLGYVAEHNAYVSTTVTEFTTANNNYAVTNLIQNSYDPNDKQVYPPGECEESYIVKGERLTYRVRFQNTGNAEAINIYILDTLSNNLNVSTIEVIHASHAMVPEILPGNVLKFNFENIWLPDSTSNEPLSHGFVLFSIETDGSIPDGSLVENTVDIYFDWNPAVRTNTVSQTAVDSIPPCEPVMVGDPLENRWVLYPNPAQDMVQVSGQDVKSIELWSLDGRRLTFNEIGGNGQHAFSVSHLPSGIYLVRIQGEDHVEVLRLQKQ